MASILTNLYDQPDIDERPMSLKRKSTSDLLDISDSDSEGNSHANDNVMIAIQRTIWVSTLVGDELDDENDIQRLTGGSKATAPPPARKLPLSTTTKLVTKNCFMAAIDLQHAYYSIHIRSLDRKFLSFIWEGNL